MTSPGGNIIFRFCGLAGLAFALSSPAFAQDNEGGMLTTLSLSETLRSDDDGVALRSAVDLSFSSVTRRDRFEFDLGGVYNLSLDGENRSNFDEPSFDLLYRREGFDSALTFSLGFQRRDIEESTFLVSDDFVGVIVEDGERETRQAGINFEWGEDAPFGGGISVGYTSTRFLDVPTASVTDSDLYDADLRLNFEIDQRITLFTAAGYSSIDRETGLDVDTTRLSLGADLAITQTLDGSFDLGYSRVVEEGVGAEPDREGFTANAAMTQSLRNGNLNGTLSTSLGESGRTTTVNLGRLIELRDGSFNFGLGYGEVEGVGRGLFSVGYVRQGRRDTIQAQFDQTFTGSNEGDAVLNSALSLSYGHQINQSSQLNFAANYRETDPLDASLGATQQWSVGLNYNHTLNETWSLTSGLSHTRRKASDGTTSTDDTIFLGLTTVMSWRR